MSTTIDNKVVEMRFDNKHFESNVATSISTLDKLKQKLNLTGASKGLQDLDAAAKKVDMNGLGRGVEAVSAKFSAMHFPIPLDPPVIRTVFISFPPMF